MFHSFDVFCFILNMKEVKRRYVRNWRKKEEEEREKCSICIFRGNLFFHNLFRRYTQQAPK